MCHEKYEVTEIIKQLEKVEIICPSWTPFTNLMGPENKLGDSWKMAMDYRQLNEVVPLIHSSTQHCSFDKKKLQVTGHFHVALDNDSIFFLYSFHISKLGIDSNSSFLKFIFRILLFVMGIVFFIQQVLYSASLYSLYKFI